MNRMAHGCKYDATVAKIVSPAADRLSAQVAVHQAIDIFRVEDDVFAIFIVFHVVLLVVNNKLADPLSDGMSVGRWLDAERAQRRVADISPPMTSR